MEFLNHPEKYWDVFIARISIAVKMDKILILHIIPCTTPFYVICT